MNQNGSDFSERQYFKDCRESMAPVTSDPYSSKEIRSINDTIGDIAFQTHILALNASIEAAAAGEAETLKTIVSGFILNTI